MANDSQHQSYKKAAKLAKAHSDAAEDNNDHAYASVLHDDAAKKAKKAGLHQMAAHHKKQAEWHANESNA